MSYEGAKSLIKGNWLNIKFIDLSNNKIGFSGYEALQQNNWKNAQKIFVGDYHEDFGGYTLDGV